MASKLFPCLAAIAFAAILFYYFLKRRSSKINGGEANNDATGNDGTAGGASCTPTSTKGHELATSSGYDYEVFLSFRGPDTRGAFTDFLYTSLIDAGIRAYKDAKELREGEEFGPKLLQAINQSKISIPIFSKGYASSVWCLKELVQMVECQKTGRQKIMPIFYDVAPSEVRYQTGQYGEAFLLHESKKRYDKETICQWKSALSAVGALNGWDLQSMPNRQDGEFAKTLTQKVFNELKKAYLVVSENLVSVDNHVNEIMKMIGAHTSETQIIGIHGLGGIGKTTIAKMVYNELSTKFHHCCFLSNIREMSKLKGIEYLQNQLISDILKAKWKYIKNIDEGTQTIKDRLSNKRVLLLLDDIEEKKHMDALVGKREWFGKGSKIIITTRQKDVLHVPEVDCYYEVDGMDLDQSLQLFSKHAFRRDYPLDEYVDQSKKAIDIAGGLPLALEVIGSLLSRTKKEMWDVTLEKLENVPPAEVQSKLKISYDALDARQQHIFLDIACLFVGYDKDIVIHFWEKSKFFPEVAMEILQHMSLIKIKADNKVWMHDQVRDLGREMVRQESRMKIEKQTRVWNPEEALALLRRSEGKTKVEALHLNLDYEWQYRFTYESFKRLSNLRFLKVKGWMKNFCAEERLLWHRSPSNVLPTNVFPENSDLLPQLRWLSWYKIPLTFNIAKFSMEDMVIIELSDCDITHDWNGWSNMKVIKKLKVLVLTYCWRLERTPNLYAHTNLERLILRNCSELVEIDSSICQLKGLVSLDVQACWNLRRLPDRLNGLEALEELRIDATGIEEIPNCQGLRNLRIFTASHCKILSLPLSIGDLASLEYLSLKWCILLEKLPDTIGNLKALSELNIAETRIKALPDSIGNLENLKVVKMNGISLSKIPDSLWTIGKLEEIEADNGFNTEAFQAKISNCINQNRSLRILRLRKAEIYAVPTFPESLISLVLGTVYMTTFPDLSNLTNLKELDLRFGRSDVVGEDPMPRWIGEFSKLESLGLESDYVSNLPADISSLLPQLKALHLDCSNLCCLPRLPSSLSSLSLHKCISLRSLDISNLKKLSTLNIRSFAISEIQGLNCLENLRDLLLYDLGQVETLPDLSNLSKLTSLDIHDCGNLVEIRGELPQSLKVLRIYSCNSLQKSPDLSRLKGLQKVHIGCCMKLNGEAIIGSTWRSQANLWENLQDLQLFLLGRLEILADLSNSNKLRLLRVQSCPNLVEIQGELPQSLITLQILYCESLQKLPHLSSLKGLQDVVIEGSMKLNEEAILGSARRSQANLWENLQNLALSGLGQVEILPDLSNSKKLRCLRVENCCNLVDIQGAFPQSLEELKICSCESLQKLPDLWRLKGLQKAVIEDCIKLNVEANLGFGLRSQANLGENLQYLRISGLEQLEILHDLSSLNKLRCFQVVNCCNLVEIRGKLPESLVKLRISSCESLQKLPDLSRLTGLQKVVIDGCLQLNVETILGFARRRQANLWEKSENKCTLLLRAS